MLDLGVLIIVGLSALLSFYRGFVREILSLGAVAVAAISLFLISLILFSIATGMIMKFLKLGEKVGLLDNLAGLCFGAARGTLIVTIIFFVMTKFFTNEKDYPEIVRHAVSRPYIEQCAEWLGTLTPDYLDKIMDKKDDKESDEPNLDDSKKHMNELIQKWDEKAKDDIHDLAPKEKLPAASLPSIEDLQKRIKEENEKR